LYNSWSTKPYRDDLISLFRARLNPHFCSPLPNFLKSQTPSRKSNPVPQPRTGRLGPSGGGRSVVSANLLLVIPFSLSLTTGYIPRFSTIATHLPPPSGAPRTQVRAADGLHMPLRSSWRFTPPVAMWRLHRVEDFRCIRYGLQHGRRALFPYSCAKGSALSDSPVGTRIVPEARATSHLRHTSTQNRGSGVLNLNTAPRS
jgi:hypothetical protein